MSEWRDTMSAPYNERIIILTNTWRPQITSAIRINRIDRPWELPGEHVSNEEIHGWIPIPKNKILPEVGKHE